jgi:hypothetical protein
MKLAGFLLLPTGWLLVLSSLALLRPGTAQNAFVLAGTGVEAIGLVLVFRAHIPVRGEER